MPALRALNIPRIVKKLATRRTRVVWSWNIEAAAAGFWLENGINNPWVAIFNLAVVPNNPADALKDPADAINNPADVPKDRADDPDIRRLR